MVFHEITRPAIEEAIEHGRELDMKLVEAHQGRRVLDRLFGYEMSLVTRRRAGGASSAGRVQSVAARLVVERERERMAFRAASYWDVEGVFAKDTEFPATLAALDGSGSPAAATSRPTTGQLAAGRRRRAARRGRGRRPGGAASRDADFVVDSVETKSLTERPRAPFTTSTLQQEAARKLGFSAARAMSIAQRLYENGYITYMRTDATTLSSEAITGAAQPDPRAVRRRVPARASPASYRGKVKNAQEAHEAIRPAGDTMRVPDELAHELASSDERRLYELIWKRTIACQMEDAKVRRVTARLSATRDGRSRDVPGDGSHDRVPRLPARRTSRAPTIPTPSSTTVRRSSRRSRRATRSRAASSRASGHTTQPPARYTEASLVKELEERGIGRPSTYAGVIDTLLRRDYVWKKGSALVPSWSAFAKLQLLERHFAHLIDYEFTATHGGGARHDRPR